MTSKNVVVAAEKMSGQAFYVACSRGRKNLSLHVPEKEFFKDRLVKIPTERKLVTDISGGVIPPIPHWKAPVLPPPPDELIGSRLRQFMDRTREQMRKVQQIVSGYIERAMYHVFNHNIRKRDHERNERIRKSFRAKFAVLERANAERERLAAERARAKQAERARVEAERPRVEAERPRVEPQPIVPERTIPSEPRIEPRPFDPTGFEERRKRMEERIAAAERAAAKRAAGKPVEQTGPATTGNGAERFRDEAEERRARLVALAEKRKRESPGGFDR